MTTESTAGGIEGLQPDAWWQRVGGLTGVPALMRVLQIDGATVLAAAGLSDDALDHPDNRIRFDTFGRLLQSAAERANYAHFGLTAGRMWHLEDLGLLTDIVRHSSSIAEALQSLARYQYLNGEGGLTFTAKHGPLFEVGYAIYYPGVVAPDQIYDFALASLFNYLRELCGASWLPVQVLIPHAAPDDPVHYRSFFKLLPQFDSEICALRFPSHWLDRPIEGADPGRRKKAVAIAEAAAKPNLLPQVYRALRSVLLSGRSSGNDVADTLSMHRRTLNRRLQECGTTFQAVLDEVRCEVARQLLCYSNVALDDVAASLAYAGVSPFMRSFRRWTGLTPGRMRRLALNNHEWPRGEAADATGDDDAPRARGAARGAKQYPGSKPVPRAGASLSTRPRERSFDHRKLASLPGSASEARWRAWGSGATFMHPPAQRRMSDG
jgi:AraC-like DNA-binding protein